jgi:signal peptidase I
MTKTPKSSPKSDSSQKETPPTDWAYTLRETVEAIAIALILAFLFRGFEAEAFVIPTGSMAPTLQGMNKDIVCEKCGFRYHTNASNESDENFTTDGRRRERTIVQSTTCPMCRYEQDVDPFKRDYAKRFPTYNGDRILVSKFIYDFKEPQRWDVVVFHYPLSAKTNYIKRLVGLPGETVIINDGDVYTKTDGGEYEIARKPTDKLVAMLQDVYDNDHVCAEFLDRGWPSRWQNVPAEGTKPVPANSPEAWQPLDGTKSFQVDGRGPETWLRYQHLLPTTADWEIVGNTNVPMPPPQPSLIRDFYAYNAYEPSHQHRSNNWVGDLALEATVTIENSQGEMLLELVKGGRRFLCVVDVATGKARLEIPGLEGFGPTASTPLTGGTTHQVLFANVDRQLRLLVDGKEIEFDKPTIYPDLGNSQPITNSVAGQGNDLSPLAIGSRGAALKVSHLKVFRDTYYTSEGNWSGRGPDGSFKLAKADPALGVEDQFLMFGDNSPESSDSRYWGPVDRHLLIGKALFIFWPHSFNKVPGLGLPFPFFPNFGDMGYVR